MMLRTIKRSGFWSWAIAILMAAQFALAFHSFEHKFNPASTWHGEECALCHVASTTTPEPSVVLQGPTSHVVERIVAVVAPLAIPAAAVAGFRSRAPPLSVSV